MVVIYVFFAFICKKNNKNFAVQKLITNFAIRTNLLTFVKKMLQSPVMPSMLEKPWMAWHYHRSNELRQKPCHGV